jgi:hypothetical protein
MLTHTVRINPVYDDGRRYQAECDICGHLHEPVHSHIVAATIADHHLTEVGQ